MRLLSGKILQIHMSRAEAVALSAVLDQRLAVAVDQGEP